MASNNKKKKFEPKAEALEEKVQDVAVVEEEAIAEEPVTEPVDIPVRPVVEVAIYRDEEGRLVLDQKGKSKRIAGSDDAFIEVARQFAEAIVKERQI